MLTKPVVRLGTLWILIVPSITIYLFVNRMPQQLNWWYISMIVLLAFLTALFPMKKNEDTVLLIVWITVPAFLLYGLLIEIIVTQIALLAKVIYYRRKKENLEQFLFRSLLFFILSFISAIAFYFAGGNFGEMEFTRLVYSVAAYQITHRILYYFGKQFYNKEIGITKEYLKRLPIDIFISLLILPFTLTLYYLVQFVGGGAFLLLGISYFFIVFMLRLHNQNEKINSGLRLVGEMGYHLTAQVKEEKVINLFTENVSEIIQADATYLFDAHNGEMNLLCARGRKGIHLFNDCPVKIEEEGIMRCMLASKHARIFGERKGWDHLAAGDYGGMHSAMVIPIQRNELVEGVLLAFSKKRHAFKGYQLHIVDIFCSYFTVSIERVRNFTEVFEKSERCGLTGLYNYTYLEERLAFEQKRLDSGEEVNLVMMLLDIDHFKKVNDTYGHQSGNDVLVELGRIFREELPDNRMVGRYGGEEFYFVLPDMTSQKALMLAENLRRKIQQHRFMTQSNLAVGDKKVGISITVSIGISALSKEVADVKTLLRNADRALYLGAKRMGRNRVSSYTKQFKEVSEC